MSEIVARNGFKMLASNEEPSQPVFTCSKVTIGTLE